MRLKDNFKHTPDVFPRMVFLLLLRMLFCNFELSVWLTNWKLHGDNTERVKVSPFWANLRWVFFFPRKLGNALWVHCRRRSSLDSNELEHFSIEFLFFSWMWQMWQRSDLWKMWWIVEGKQIFACNVLIVPAELFISFIKSFLSNWFLEKTKDVRQKHHL